MYKDIVEGVNETLEIDGFPFYAEDIRGDNSFNRRELVRQKLLGGTESVTRGKYLPREYSFTTTVYTEGNPKIFDDILLEMSNKQCEVISEYMGGKFMAEVIFERRAEECTPEHWVLDVTVNEIPEAQPNIPGESFVIPEDILQEDNAEVTETETESNITSIKETSNNTKELDSLNDLDEIKKYIKSRWNS